MELFPPSFVFWFSVCVLVIFCTTGSGAIELPGNVTVTAVFVFGDSIVDTGNNNNKTTLAKCNFPPYGRDFKGGVPTGRFSNGKVPADILVEELGIKELLPAYLDPNLQPEDLLTGVNFASGGAGYDPLTSQIEIAISLADQLKLFKEYTQKLKNLVGEEETNTIFTNSLFAVVVGSNDIANAYYNSHIRQLQFSIFAYTDFLATSASNFLQELYSLGARRIAAFGAPPLGCLPSTRTVAGNGKRDECIKEYNQGSELFNTKFSAAIASLGRNLPDAKVVYIDIYNPLLTLIENPSTYGFEFVDKGCCGSGTIEAAFTCNSLTPPCPDASIYIFWDSFHPSETTYKILVSQIVQKYANSFL
ncbi:GDSL esterase/lipase EXL3-like [Mangifera indica]|uniref:GDSL esterase/lipase EXL3-like n=1 Tax=Mangifera indica TaxID=29780 RepID=UPI001CFA1416|nr:GDSL esterase/lipase EXL3-like [Mangifera indica]